LNSQIIITIKHKVRYVTNKFLNDSKGGSHNLVLVIFSWCEYYWAWGYLIYPPAGKALDIINNTLPELPHNLLLTVVNRLSTL